VCIIRQALQQILQASGNFKRGKGTGGRCGGLDKNIKIDRIHK
jgi:hypothetical protein